MCWNHCERACLDLKKTCYIVLFLLLSSSIHALGFPGFHIAYSPFNNNNKKKLEKFNEALKPQQANDGWMSLKDKKPRQTRSLLLKMCETIRNIALLRNSLLVILKAFWMILDTSRRSAVNATPLPGPHGCDGWISVMLLLRIAFYPCEQGEFR